MRHVGVCSKFLWLLVEYNKQGPKGVVAGRKGFLAFLFSICL